MIPRVLESEGFDVRRTGRFHLFPTLNGQSLLRAVPHQPISLLLLEHPLNFGGDTGFSTRFVSGRRS